jgi:GntR family transcriptional regulator
LTTVNERDWRPGYVQVAEELREEIRDGKLEPGTPMPSEPELAERFGLSRTTVRNAVKQLRDWGLVRTEQGRGTFVRTERQRVRRDHTERYQWEKDRVGLHENERRKTGATEHDTGLNLEDLEFRSQYGSVEASPDLAKRFGVPPGTRLLRRDYWTSSRAEKVPLNLARSYLLYDMVAANPDLLEQGNEPWPGGTHHQLSTIGVELDRIVDEVTARPPFPDEAEALDIEPGVSVLVLRKASIDTLDRIVEISDVIMPGDRTELVYTIRLSRWSS